MLIPVYQIRSTLTQVSDDAASRYLSAVSAAAGHELARVSAEEFAAAPFGLVFVASGGSEGFFMQEFDRLTARKCYILTSGESNSLAASMEILSCLRQRGRPGEILHGSLADTAARVNALARAFAAREKLRGSTFGCVGDPSDWLIASSCDDTALRQKLGMSVRMIPIDELIAESRREIAPDTADPAIAGLLAAGWDRDEVMKALYVYTALDRITQKYGLAGVTVRCFDLLGPLGTTGCLALALLNARGIYAGCEGDVPSLISMAILGEVSCQPVFLCNPSRIDTEKSEMVLAHCTLPLNMPASYTLMTHYESNIGVALRGKIAEGACTVFKSSIALDRYHAQRATILENLEDPTLCRTQIRLRVSDTAYFLTDPIANHHLIARGDHTASLKAFWDIL